MRYQLVLQLPYAGNANYDALLEIEAAIDAAGIAGVDLDGHDFGSGEMNIFIFTDDPEEAFSRMARLPALLLVESKLKVAFRDGDRDGYTTLYPEHLTEFTVL